MKNNYSKKRKQIILAIIAIAAVLITVITLNKALEDRKKLDKKKEIKAEDITLKPITETKGLNENVTNIVPKEPKAGVEINNNNEKKDNKEENNVSNNDDKEKSWIIQTEEEFKEKVVDSKEKAIVYFFASWCGPCKTMKPIMAELLNEGVKIYKIDIENNELRKVIYDAGIRAIPTYVYYNNGKEVTRNYGIISKSNIKEKYEKMQ